MHFIWKYFFWWSKYWLSNKLSEFKVFLCETPELKCSLVKSCVLIHHAWLSLLSMHWETGGPNHIHRNTIPHHISVFTALCLSVTCMPRSPERSQIEWNSHSRFWEVENLLGVSTHNAIRDRIVFSVCGLKEKRKNTKAKQHCYDWTGEDDYETDSSVWWKTCSFCCLTYSSLWIRKLNSTDRWLTCRLSRIAPILVASLISRL